MYTTQEQANDKHSEELVLWGLEAVDSSDESFCSSGSSLIAEV